MFHISPEQERENQEKLDHMIGALFAARLDKALGREGPGHAASRRLTRHDKHGGELPAFIGTGIDVPSYDELEEHLGEGFGSWLKKTFSFAKKHVEKHKDKIGKVLRDAVDEAKKHNDVKSALEGGLRAAGTSATNIAREEAQKKIRSIIGSSA
nr:hypothetical protein [Nitrosomonas nitrosa]